MSMSPIAESLLDAYLRPARAASFDAADWNEVLRLATRWGVLPRLALRLRAGGQLDGLAAKSRDRLEAGIALSRSHERAIRWEANRVERALRAIDTPVVVLKGGAYILTGLPASQGRLMSDLDILVPRGRLATVEQALLGHGWTFMEPNEYDDYYYRHWTHELPPMVHRDRLTALDVHHTILPPLGNLKPDPALLFANARPIEGTRFHVLAPEDMVLHSAAHLFQDGEMAGGIRDLTDLDLLLGYFGTNEPGFWERLVPRAQSLHLTRPLFYALRFSRRLLGTAIPPEVDALIVRFGPPGPVLALMDGLTDRALLPPAVDSHGWDIDLANFLLLIRGHWLKMPLPILAKHLTHKTLRPRRQRQAEAAKEAAAPPR